MLTILGTLAVAFLCFCAFHFIGNPLLKFRDLRNEITARLADTTVAGGVTGASFLGSIPACFCFSISTTAFS